MILKPSDWRISSSRSTMITLWHLPSWLCKNFRKGRAIGLVVFCIITVVMFSKILPSTPIPNVVWPEFSLHMPFVEPKISVRDRNNLYLAVAVNSAASGAKHRELRKTIRETWGNSATHEHTNKTWKLFFVLGISENKTEHGMNLREASRHNDVIIGNFTDYYKSVILKTFMSHYWIHSKFPSCKYILKTDDDVYARIPMLLRWLEAAGAPSRFYGGYVGYGQRIVRDPKSKWFLTKEQYEQKYWPPFCHGAFHVLSTDILPQYFNYTRFRRKPFHTDDAYLGVVAHELGIKATNMPGFKLRFKVKPRSACDLLTSTTMGHKIDASTMKKYYNFYTKEMENLKYGQLKCSASNPKLSFLAAIVNFSFFVVRIFLNGLQGNVA